MKYQDLEKNPGYQLWLATNAWQRILRRVLDPIGLTHVQFVLLATIDFLNQEAGGQVTQAQVSRFADTDENMTSQVIRTLADHGLVERNEHPTDARARSLALNAKGAALLGEAKDAVLPARAKFFAPVQDESEELAELLRRIVAGAERD